MKIPIYEEKLTGQKVFLTRHPEERSDEGSHKFMMMCSMAMCGFFGREGSPM